MNESGSGERLHLHLDCKKNPNYLILLNISYVKNVLPCSSTSELEDDSVICAAFTSWLTSFSFLKEAMPAKSFSFKWQSVIHSSGVINSSAPVEKGCEWLLFFTIGGSMEDDAGGVLPSDEAVLVEGAVLLQVLFAVEVGWTPNELASAQKSCILYWFRHLSVQNCNWRRPSFRST